MLSVAWMDIRGGNGAVFDPFIEQQGSLIKQVDGQSTILRWASLAADDGPSVCLRILKRDAAAGLPGLEQLGYLSDQIALLDRIMLSEGGVVVFAGTVGSGKSRSEAHTSDLQSLMRNSYAVFCLKTKPSTTQFTPHLHHT